MKRKLAFILMSLALVAIIYAIWYSLPKQIYHTTEGLQFQLGNENSSFQQPVIIKVDGRFKKSIFDNDEFKGTIMINGESIPPPNAENEKLQLTFDDDNGAFISYWLDSETGLGRYEIFGEIFINNDFRELTIAKFEQEESSAGWNGQNGFMISAPAANRKEALEISNGLMKKRLNDSLQ